MDKNLLTGLILIGVGAILTGLTYQSALPGGTYFIFYGLVIYGAWFVFKSLFNETSTIDNPINKPLVVFSSVLILVCTAWFGWSIWQNATAQDSDRLFKLGLDLAGGSQLVYEADVTNIDPLEVPELMGTLRTVIERRVNSLGTEENSVYLEKSSVVASEEKHRLVVELPGVTDIAAAVEEIGRTPLLEFKLIDANAMTAQQEALATMPAEGGEVDFEVLMTTLGEVGEPYVDTGLTGRYLESAALEFASGQGGQLANEPIVSIRFNREGGELFASITRANVGERLAIFLDGEVISSPRINEAITGGTAIISGGFNPVEARELAQNLNLGALPVPIELVNTQTIGATLGSEVLERGMIAGVVGFIIVSLFMIAYYRLPGLLAVLALVTYITLMLGLFQWLPVTLTAAGLAGFVLSIGIAVDANVLVFERFKEELRVTTNATTAVKDGFIRAWSAIRDGNITSILSAIVLFWFGTSMVKGFALVFGIGVIVSMLTAVLVTRTLLLATTPSELSPQKRKWLYGVSDKNS